MLQMFHILLYTANDNTQYNNPVGVIGDAIHCSWARISQL